MYLQTPCRFTTAAYWQHNTSIRHLQTSSFLLRRHSSSCFSSPCLSHFWEHQQMRSLDPFLCCKITDIPWTPAIGVLTRGLVLLRSAQRKRREVWTLKSGSQMCAGLGPSATLYAPALISAHKSPRPHARFGASLSRSRIHKLRVKSLKLKIHAVNL